MIDVRFAVSVFDNGQYTEWNNSYDSPSVLQGIVATICPAILSWTKLQPDLTTTDPRCSVSPPHRRHPVGRYVARFATLNQDVLDETSLKVALKNTPADPARKFDITAIPFSLTLTGSSTATREW
ncbi:unnamed protein product [Dicrocoelium dendriticum]|nr:unnamed protein product [Dicrocoelium dendriticum]